MSDSYSDVDGRESDGRVPRIDFISERVLSLLTRDGSTPEGRAALLEFARSGFTRSDTIVGGDGIIDIPPITLLVGDGSAAAVRRQSSSKEIGNPGREPLPPGDTLRPRGDDSSSGRVDDRAATGLPADNDLAGQRRHITEMARLSLSERDFRDFQARMSEFELRARTRGLPDDEVARTYKQVARLFEAAGALPLSTDQYHRLAMQVMENAADPTNISQGNNETCSVAVIETSVYTINPSDAARIVADIAITGRHTTRTGHEVEIDPAPRTEEAMRDANRANGERVHASEIFQIAAVNMYYRSTGSNVRYDQLPAQEGDNGERLYRGSREIARSPELSDADILETARLITGHDRVRMIHAPSNANAHPSVDVARTQQELQRLLARAREEGRLPIIVRLNARLEPIGSYADDLNPLRLQTLGAHVVTITDYHPGQTPSVSLDNQWSRSSDFLGEGRLSVENLWTAMQSGPEALQIVQQQVDSLRAAGRFDPAKEIELIRLQVAARRFLDSERVTHSKDPNLEERIERLRLQYGIMNQEELNAAFDRVWEGYVSHCASSQCGPQDNRLLEALVLGPMTTHADTMRRIRLLDEFRVVPADSIDRMIGRMMTRWSDRVYSGRETALAEINAFVATLPEARRRSIEQYARNLRT